MTLSDIKYVKLAHVGRDSKQDKCKSNLILKIRNIACHIKLALRIWLY